MSNETQTFVFSSPFMIHSIKQKGIKDLGVKDAISNSTLIRLFYIRHEYFTGFVLVSSKMTKLQLTRLLFKSTSFGVRENSVGGESYFYFILFIL